MITIHMDSMKHDTTHNTSVLQQVSYCRPLGSSLLPRTLACWVWSLALDACMHELAFTAVPAFPVVPVEFQAHLGLLLLCTCSAVSVRMPISCIPWPLAWPVRTFCWLMGGGWWHGTPYWTKEMVQLTGSYYALDNWKCIRFKLWCNSSLIHFLVQAYEILYLLIWVMWSGGNKSLYKYNILYWTAILME